MDWPHGCPYAEEFKDEKCFLYKYGPCKKMNSNEHIVPCVLANFEHKNTNPDFEHGMKKS